MALSKHHMAMKAACVFLSIVAVANSEEASTTLSDEHPGLTSGALSYATLGELPEGAVLKAGELEISSAELDDELGNADASVRAQLAKNMLFLLEQLATGKLLLLETEASGAGDSAPDASEKDVIQKHLEKTVGNIEVTDEEVARFYEENKDMCGGASLDQIKDQLEDYVLGQKKQDAVNEYIRTMGQRVEIALSADWVKEQAKLALDNPVDKARGSGKPSLIDFGSTGCRPCDMMAPILEKLETQYEGKLNVLFIHVREEQILAARYGIQSIPVQIFFDRDGKEIYRHTGFYPQDEIEKRLKEMGVE